MQIDIEVPNFFFINLQDIDFHQCVRSLGSHHTGYSSDADAYKKLRRELNNKSNFFSRSQQKIHPAFPELIMSSHTEGSTKAIFYALGANGGIAIAKFSASIFTGSNAMMAEAIHSLADCTNQIFLLLGLKESKKPANELHPMGYGRVVYFWA